jgi:hypothetical protein
MKIFGFSMNYQQFQLIVIKFFRFQMRLGWQSTGGCNKRWRPVALTQRISRDAHPNGKLPQLQPRRWQPTEHRRFDRLAG